MAKSKDNQAEAFRKKPSRSETERYTYGGYSDIDPTQPKCYGVTVKKLAGSTASIDEYVKLYYNIENAVGNRGFFGKRCYELDSSYKIHMHTTLCIHPGFYLKRLKRKGFNIDFAYLETPDDVDRWHEYISKDENLPGIEQLQLLYNSGYLFPEG